MDVRCDKCATEYELDDAKVTEAGVTVKCTSCGHLFKVRRRTASQLIDMPPAPGGAPGDDKVWMIRSPTGQIQRFRELTTLQQWIVERKVTREFEISRTGDTWRKLGEIAELASFFLVVDQANAAAKAASEPGGPRRQTQPFAPSPQQPPATPRPGRVTTPAHGAAPPVPTDKHPAGGPVSPLPAAAAPAGLTTLRGHETLDTPRPGPAPQPGPLGSPPAPMVPPQSTGATGPMGVIGPVAGTAPSGPMAPPSSVPGNEPSGPVGGLRGAPVLEPGFASSTAAINRSRQQIADGGGDEPPMVARPMPSPQPEPDDFSDLDEGYRPPSRWPWIALGLVLAVAGGVGVYFLVKPKDPAQAAAPTADAAPAADAAATAAVTPLAPPDAAVAPAAVDALAEGWARFYEDGDAAFEAAEKSLEKARTADAAKDAEALSALALVNSAWAQALADDADLAQAADARRAEQLRAESSRRLQRADKFAKEALAKAPKAPEALVAMADVRRLQKAKPAEIDKLLAGAKGHPEAVYVRAMTRYSAGQLDEARKLLETVVVPTGVHVRAKYRLAWIAWQQKRWDDARREIGEILVARPEHARAKLLADRVAADSGAAATPETPPDAGPVAVSKPGGGGTSPPPPGGDDFSGPITSDAYDGLVAKGNQRAENGDCAGAMKYFERALDARPSGVEALTGLGYCHLDKKEYARAQASFRAALGISPRFGDAIIGLAEAYRYQGQNDKAVEFYQKYLEAHPNGPKAEMARRHIKALSPEEPKPPTPDEPKPEPPKQDPPPEGVTVPDPQ